MDTIFELRKISLNIETSVQDLRELIDSEFLQDNPSRINVADIVTASEHLLNALQIIGEYAGRPVKYNLRGH